LFDLVEGGAYEEITLSENRSDLLAVRLRQRVMRDVSNLDTATTVLGQKLRLPVILAPIGACGMVARRAEAQGARAAEAFGVPFCLSTVSICSIEEVRQATSAPFWFQLYMMRDRGYVRALLERAQEAGCSALVFTVDLAVLGSRYRDVRNGVSPTAPLMARIKTALDMIGHTRWFFDVAIKGRPLLFGNITDAAPLARDLAHLKKWVDEQFDASVTWRDIEWVRDIWKGPIVIKGILNAEDARAAAEVGANAVVVSNHGGRQLDCAPSTISVLPRIADAVGDQVEVLMDGGIRSGQDVAKALALGARACLIGRAWVYGVAARGERGVREVLDILRRELKVTLALLGVKKIDELDRSAIEFAESQRSVFHSHSD
jgi:L-lactate dehydrogenase (cytochrome)